VPGKQKKKGPSLRRRLARSAAKREEKAPMTEFAKKPAAKPILTPNLHQRPLKQEQTT